MNLSDHFEQSILNHYFFNVADAAPTGYLVSLWAGDPGPNAVLPGEPPLVGVGYARQSMSNANWTLTGDGQIQNGISLTFGPCVAAPWGSIDHIVIWDASGPQPMLIGTFSLAKTVNVGDSFVIPAGQITITFD